MKQTRWASALAALSLGVIGAIFIGKLPPAIPALRSEFHLSLLQSGWMVSMFNALGVVASIFMGLLAARAGAWRLCLFGAAAMLAGALCGALAQGVALLLASRFLEGVGFLCIVVAAPALLTRAAAPGDRKRLFGYWGAYMPTGTTLGMLLAPLLIGALGWRALWLATALCACGALLLLVWRRKDFALGDDEPRNAPGWRESAAPLRTAGPWWIALAFACYAFNYYAIMVWLPTFMVGERQTPLLAASLLTALVVVVNIPGNILGGVLMQRGVARGTNVCLAGVASVVTVLLIFSPALPDWLRYLACVAFSFSVGVLPGSVMSAALTHARNAAQVGTVQGMITQGANLGGFASPLLVAAVVGVAMAWSNLLYLLLASSLVVFASGLVIRRIERRVEADRSAGAALPDKRHGVIAGR